MRTLILVALALLVYDVAALAQTPTPTPNIHPGYWQVQPGIFVPCNGIKPFQPFVNVGDGITYYLGGDVNANLAHPNLYGTYIDAIYYNHTRAIYSAEGFITPLFPQLGPINFYPAPSTAANVCTQYAGYGNTLACPTTTDASYTQKFLSNQVWTQSYAVYQPSINLACNGVQPTAPPTPTRTPTPGPTATPGPSPFTDWIYQAKAESLMAGCSATLFCPGDPAATTWQGIVSRGQMAVFLLKAEHGASYLPPACTPPGAFTDVPCVAP
jgi:hypothetical protein